MSDEDARTLDELRAAVSNESDRSDELMDMIMSGYDLTNTEPWQPTSPSHSIPTVEVDGKLVFERDARWFGQSALHAEQQFAAGLGQLDPPPVTGKQRLVETLLQCPDLRRNRSRGHVQCLGAPGEAQPGGDGLEGTQRVKRNALHNLKFFLTEKE